ncbi:MAG: DNA-processing protein DprA, partial [Clostridiales bacterium]|nr:DNA-processing protein DprA [Clostridiales bacterium]
MNYTADEKAIIWLCACTDLDDRVRAALLRAAKSPADLFENWNEIYGAVINERKNGLYTIDRSKRERELNSFIKELESRNRFVITIATADYPEELSHIPVPPLMLYGEGNRELLKKQKFCIVGSRLTPPWAEKQARLIAERLSEKFVIVTGLAEGGDSAAIAGAMQSGDLICVLPNGLNECYPAAHHSLKERVAKQGLLLSEYPLNEGVKKFYFHERNRILAGLSKGVLVVSAGAKSGTLITASCALEYGRDVFAFPHNLGSAQGAGCNELIKSGAYLATGAEDILSNYGMEVKKSVAVELTTEEETILAILREAGELHAAVIAERAGVPIYEATATLSS